MGGAHHAATIAQILVRRCYQQKHLVSGFCWWAARDCFGGGRAVITVFDLSEGQLQQDQMVAAREQLNLKTVQGDMRNLSVFQDEQFDLIVRPTSNLYMVDVTAVWKECLRVLKPQGVLLASFYNPVVFVGDRNLEYAEQGYIRPQYRLLGPFATSSIGVQDTG